MGLLEKVQKALEGKKTYIVALLIGAGAVLSYLGVDIPEFVWSILGMLGLGAVRSAVGKIENK